MSRIKIMHIADTHLGSSLSSLPADKSPLRQKEMLYTFIRSVEKASDCDVLLLSGDIFDSGAVPLAMADMFLDSIEALGELPVFYACGNHDSYHSAVLSHCIRNKPDNLHIFPPDRVDYVELSELGCRVYGASFSSSVCAEPLIGGDISLDDGFVNILCMHGELSPGIYNYLDVNKLAKIGFDYAALGHVHGFGAYKIGNTAYAYPGIMEGRGFDECGEKGYISAVVSKGQCDIAFIPAAGRMYIDEKVDISEFANEYELAGLLAELCGGEGNICRFCLVGENNMGRDIDCDFLEKELPCFHGLCLDQSTMAMSIEDYISDTDFRGICARRALAMLENSSDEAEREKIKKAFSLLTELFG